MRIIIHACFGAGLPVSAAGFALLAAALSKISLPLRCYPAAQAFQQADGTGKTASAADCWHHCC